MRNASSARTAIARFTSCAYPKSAAAIGERIGARRDSTAKTMARIVMISETIFSTFCRI